jgi:UDP-N-acetylmuramyl tripeptide synthase
VTIPRSEDPQAILDEIRVAAPGAEIIADRGEAIRRTILRHIRPR